jgi:hypothetical protein
MRRSLLIVTLATALILTGIWGAGPAVAVEPRLEITTARLVEPEELVLTGRITCTTRVDQFNNWHLVIFIYIEQKRGQESASGYAEYFGECSGGAQLFTVSIDVEAGSFRPGRMFVDAQAWHWRHNAEGSQDFAFIASVEKPLVLHPAPAVPA